MKDVIKARIKELELEVDRVKKDLLELRESSQGKFGAEEIEKIDSMTKELIAYKSGIAELIGLLN